MFIVDTALAQREADGKPIRVGIIGAGFMSRAVSLQLAQYTPGIRLVAIANRTIEKARQAFTGAGIPSEAIRTVDSQAALEQAITEGVPAITDDVLLPCKADGIDVIVEIVGGVEFGAHVVMTAINHGKHIVTMNADVIGTLGSVLQAYADKAGVRLSLADGDQPGVTVNLFRYVKGIGVKPVLCGNIKGLHDPYRNPTTQEAFAKSWGQSPYMVTSFADGTKISFEQAVVANATGMRVAKRGMLGPTVPAGTHLGELTNSLYPLDVLLDGPGIVDYVVGAVPGPGVFVLGIHDHPTMHHYMNYYKLGTGPLYLFYTPYHLCHFELPSSIARVVIFNDMITRPLGGPSVDVITAAKVDLKAGDTIDRLGGYSSYGLAENSDVVQAENLLPIGLAEGCCLKRDVPKDTVLTYDDVEVPEGRLCDKLRAEQNAMFGAPVSA